MGNMKGYICRCEDKNGNSSESSLKEQWYKSRGQKMEYLIYFCPKCQIIKMGQIHPQHYWENISFSALRDNEMETPRECLEYCQEISNTSDLRELFDVVVCNKETVMEYSWEHRKSTEEIRRLLSYLITEEIVKDKFELFYAKEYEKEILEALKNILINEVQAYTP